MVVLYHMQNPPVVFFVIFLQTCETKSGMESLGTSLKIYNLIDSHLIQDAKTYTNNQVHSVTKKKTTKL